MMKNKPVVGQVLHILLIGNAARGKKGTELITQGRVKTVGRKYFTIDVLGDTKFTLNGAEVTRHSRCYTIYESRQEIYDDIDKERIMGSFLNVFRYSVPGDISADTMRQMNALLPLKYQAKLCSDG